MRGNPAAALSGAAAAVVVERKETKEERKAEKQEARAQREFELGAKQLALLSKCYGVILADPEWRFELIPNADRSIPRRTTTTRHRHWTKSRREVPSIAADDSVLFLWATVPMLPHALEVMAAWGFTYVSSFVWVKDKAGTRPSESQQARASPAWSKKG